MNQEKIMGSKWRKWDLHIHTPASHLDNQYGDDWDGFVQALFKRAIERGIYVIGLTDYFTIDGYKKIKQEYIEAEGKLDSLFDEEEIQFIREMLILPNIEFRLNTFVGSNSINMHVIFSDKVPIKDIEENFLHELDFVYQGAPQTNDEKLKLKIDNLADLGKKLKRDHKQFVELSDISVGMRNAVVDHSQISSVLEAKPSKFKGKYLLGVVADEDLCDIDWNSRDHHTRKVLIQKSDCLLASNPKTVKWALGEEPYKEDIRKFIQEFRSLKPCIHGSDAHSKELIGHPCIHRGTKGHNCTSQPEDCKLRFCWVKADTTFEGLKQILYEPKFRIRLQQDDPAESETYARIGSLTLDLPDELTIKDEAGEETPFCLNGHYSLNFSNNLTCIIGGRGSGKSTLAHIIYNSWSGQDIGRLANINSPLVTLQLSPNPLKKIASLTKCDIPSQVEFFFQNEIEFDAKNIESMSELISNRLRKLSSVQEGSNLEEIQDIWRESSDSINKLIVAYDEMTSIDFRISKATEEIGTLKKQTEIITSSEYKDFQNHIGEFSAKIASFKAYQKDHERLVKDIESLAKSIIQLKWSDEQGLNILQKLLQALNEYKAELQAVLASYKTTYAQQDYSAQLAQVQKELRDYLNERGLSPENTQELTQANTKIKELEEEIRLARLERQPHEQIFDEGFSTIEAYKSNHTKYRERFVEVSSHLQEKLKGLSISDKEVSFDITVDNSKLKGAIVAFVKSNLKDETTLYANIIEQLLFSNADITTYIADKNNIREHVNNSSGAEKHRQVILELINDDVFLEKSHLRLIKHAFDIENIQVKTKLGGKLLKNTSFGERCGIVIAIVLVAGTNPIVIDQPEDHLDGKFISDVLVPLLQDQKHNRQVILITRDANIVIGGDSELIHILEPTDKRSNVLSSSIENIEHRHKYIWILDGGTEAFIRREQKYSIDLLEVDHL